MSDSVWPHRRQPTRLPPPWDSPGKNTGVGCHFLLQRMKVKSESEVAQSCPTLSDPMDCSLTGSTYIWSIVDIQCSVSFRCIAKLISYTHNIVTLFRLFSHIGYYRILHRVPCAIKRFVLIIYFLYSYVYVNLSLLIFPPPCLLLVSISLFSTSVTLFLFHKKICLYHCLSIPNISVITWYLYFLSDLFL